MLRRIPYTSHKDMDPHFDSIDSKLSDYEHYLEDSPMLLELAIWKSKFTDLILQNTDNDIKMQFRADSLSMALIIVRNVLSFL